METWNLFLGTLTDKSSLAYRKTLLNFEAYLAETGGVENEFNISSVTSWIRFLRLDSDLAASTLWSICSKLGPWFEAHGHPKPCENPLLKKILKKYGTEDDVKKSRTLSSEDLDVFLKTAPNDDEYLPIKALLIAGHIYIIIKINSSSYIYGIFRRLWIKPQI